MKRLSIILLTFLFGAKFKYSGVDIPNTMPYTNTWTRTSLPRERGGSVERAGSVVAEGAMSGFSPEVKSSLEVISKYINGESLLPGMRTKETVSRLRHETLVGDAGTQRSWDVRQASPMSSYHDVVRQDASLAHTTLSHTSLPKQLDFTQSSPMGRPVHPQVPIHGQQPSQHSSQHAHSVQHSGHVDRLCKSISPPRRVSLMRQESVPLQGGWYPSPSPVAMQVPHHASHISNVSNASNANLQYSQQSIERVQPDTHSQSAVDSQREASLYVAPTPTAVPTPAPPLMRQPEAVVAEVEEREVPQSLRYRTFTLTEVVDYLRWHYSANKAAEEELLLSASGIHALSEEDVTQLTSCFTEELLLLKRGVLDGTANTTIQNTSIQIDDTGPVLEGVDLVEPTASQPPTPQQRRAQPPPLPVHSPPPQPEQAPLPVQHGRAAQTPVRPEPVEELLPKVHSVAELAEDTIPLQDKPVMESVAVQSSPPAEDEFTSPEARATSLQPSRTSGMSDSMGRISADSEEARSRSPAPAPAVLQEAPTPQYHKSSAPAPEPTRPRTVSIVHNSPGPVLTRQRSSTASAAVPSPSVLQRPHRSNTTVESPTMTKYPPYSPAKSITAKSPPRPPPGSPRSLMEVPVKASPSPRSRGPLATPSSVAPTPLVGVGVSPGASQLHIPSASAVSSLPVTPSNHAQPSPQTSARLPPSQSEAEEEEDKEDDPLQGAALSGVCLLPDTKCLFIRGYRVCGVMPE